MVGYKIDSSVGRLWVRLLTALTTFFDWVGGVNSKARPSPLKGFTVSITKGNST
jgi:hypothetical protein